MNQKNLMLFSNTNVNICHPFSPSLTPFAADRVTMYVMCVLVVALAHLRGVYSSRNHRFHHRGDHQPGHTWECQSDPVGKWPETAHTQPAPSVTDTEPICMFHRPACPCS